MTWKIVLYCEFNRRIKNKNRRRSDIQNIMRFSRSHGAKCDWVEPDGSVVNKAEIDALCSMTEEQLEAQYQPRFKYPNWYTWEDLTAKERVKAEAGRFLRLSGSGYKQHPSFSYESADEYDSMKCLSDHDEYQFEHDSGPLSSSSPSPSFE